MANWLLPASLSWLCRLLAFINFVCAIAVFVNKNEFTTTACCIPSSCLVKDPLPRGPQGMCVLSQALMDDMGCGPLYSDSLGANCSLPFVADVDKYKQSDPCNGGLRDFKDKAWFLGVVVGIGFLAAVIGFVTVSVETDKVQQHKETQWKVDGSGRYISGSQKTIQFNTTGISRAVGVAAIFIFCPSIVALAVYSYLASALATVQEPAMVCTASIYDRGTYECRANAMTPLVFSGMFCPLGSQTADVVTGMLDGFKMVAIAAGSIALAVVNLVTSLSICLIPAICRSNGGSSINGDSLT